jgi:hypothetical protein
MPWLPFFQKVEDADVFCILVNCQFEKNGYQNRFNIDDKWYTLPVKSGTTNIVDKLYVNPAGDWAKIKTKLPQYEKVLSHFDQFIDPRLGLMNSRIIVEVADILGTATKIVFDEPMEEKSTDRLVKICQMNGCDKYIAGSGGAAYLDYSKFEAAGIEVITQDLNRCLKVPILDLLARKLNVAV